MPFPNPSFSNNDLSNPNNRQTPGISSYMPRQNAGNIGFNGIPGAANYQPQTQVIGRPGFELGGVPIFPAQQPQAPGAGVSTLAPNMGNASSTILPTDPNNPPTRPGFVNNKGPAPNNDSSTGYWGIDASGNMVWTPGQLPNPQHQGPGSGFAGYNQGGGMRQGNKNPQTQAPPGTDPNLNNFVYGAPQQPSFNGGKNPSRGGGGSTQPVYPGRG